MTMMDFDCFDFNNYKEKKELLRQRCGFEDLKQIWSNYREPQKDVLDAHNEYVEEVRQIRSEDPNAYVANQDQNGRMRQDERGRFGIISVGGPSNWNQNDPIEKVERCYQIYPRTGEVDRNPLEFTGGIYYELFKNDVIDDTTQYPSPFSLCQTLRNVLMKAETYGLSKKQLAGWLKMFIEEKYPGCTCVSYTDPDRDPESVWNTIVSDCQIDCCYRISEDQYIYLVKEGRS